MAIAQRRIGQTSLAMYRRYLLQHVFPARRDMDLNVQDVVERLFTTTVGVDEASLADALEGMFLMDVWRDAPLFETTEDRRSFYEDVAKQYKASLRL